MPDISMDFESVTHFEDDAFPVSRITAGAVGELGRRVFVLQAHIGPESYSWVLAKEQMQVLSRSIPGLLADIQARFPELDDPIVAADPNLALSEPLHPQFLVGSLDIGYSRLHDLVLLKLLDASVLRIDADEHLEEPAEHRVYTTRGQALLLSRQAESVVFAGRPRCPACGDPVDDFGHFCRPPASGARSRMDYLH